MSCDYSPKFHLVDSIGQRQTLSGLEENIKSFLDWSFINIGAFINVNIPTNGIDNSQYHKLTVSDDPNYTANTVWQAQKKDWVYETGVSYETLSPIEISGVYLNGSFLIGPTGYSSYTYSLDYQNGRVIFDNAVNKNSDVQIEYSYRHIQTYNASQHAGLELNKDALSTHKIELPSILVEMTDRTIQKPYELGNAKNIIYQDILLHILANNPAQRNNIANILLLQKDQSLILYDINKIIENGVYPFNYSGTINNNRINYGLLFNNVDYMYKKAHISNATITEFNLIGNDIFHSIVRWTLEIFP